MHKTLQSSCLRLFFLISLSLFHQQVKAGYFEKVYGQNPHTQGVLFAKTVDHGIVVLGTTTDTVPHSGYYLLKLDSDGAILWQKKYIDDFDAYSYSITTLTDGRILILGTHTGVLYQIVAEIMVFDSQGNFLDAEVYPPFNGWGTAGVAMTTTGDSSVSIIIYNDGFISNNYYSVFSLNPDLSTKWSDFVSFDGSFTNAHGITSVFNDDVFTMSYYDNYFFNPQPLFRVSHIRVHAENGSLKLDSLYEFNCITTAITTTRDSGAVICGIQDSSLQKDIVIIRLDNNGNVLWQKQMGSSLSEESNSIIQTSDNGFAILSTISDAVIPGQHDIQLLKVGANGDSLWSHNFGGVYDELALHLAEDNSDLILMASTNSFNNDLIYIVRTDSSGSLKSPYDVTVSNRYFCNNDTATLLISPVLPVGAHVLWSNGDTLNPAKVCRTGNYFATITEQSGLTYQTSFTPVYFSALPNAYFESDTIHLCNGAVLSDTATSELTNTYQWYLNDIILPGEIYPEYSPQQEGNYKLVVNNYCKSDSSVSFIDTLYDLPNIPVITAPSFNNVCLGDSVGLSISSVPGETYQWYTTDNINNFIQPGETDTVFYVHQSGWYIVEASNANGCSIFSWSFPVFYDDGKELVSPNGPTHFCNGGEVVLSIAGGTSFNWSNGDTTQNITVRNTGDYFVSFIDQNNCYKTSDTVSISVFNNPLVDLGADTNLCDDDSIMLDAGSGFNVYFWNDGSSFQTNLAFSDGKFPDSSIYIVSVIDTNGCTNADTVNIVFDICIGVDQLTDLPAGLFPNPAKSGENLHITGINPGSQLKITDVFGRDVFIKDFEHETASVFFFNPIRGMYFYTIQHNGRVYSSGKLIIN